MVFGSGYGGLGVTNVNYPILASLQVSLANATLRFEQLDMMITIFRLAVGEEVDNPCWSLLDWRLVQKPLKLRGTQWHCYVTQSKQIEQIEQIDL